MLLFNNQALNFFYFFFFSEILKFKGIEPLVDLLSDSRELAVANACCVLTNMAPDEGLRTEICNKGVVSALIEPMQSK